MYVILQWTCFWLCLIYASEAVAEIRIAQGLVQGTYRKTWNGRLIHAFYGIPYAEPPIGLLRFTPPVPAKSWQGILNASKPSENCPQLDGISRKLIGKDDCLYLNIYTPELNISRSELLPVMLFIHGGAFTLGSGDPELYGPDILLDRDVILVTINYRLGALGFLSTGDNVAPGNNGLKDQTMALKWTKENIQAFGGDSNKILIFGQSAGGASVHYHMLSPLSRGLFQAAIAHSGTAFAPWGRVSTKETLQNSKILAKRLKCPDHPSDIMIDCLRNIDYGTILAQDNYFLEWHFDPMVPFKPIIEVNPNGAFLSEHPINIIKSGNVASVPFITGFTSEDGTLKSAGIFHFPNLVKEFNTNFTKIMPLILQDKTDMDKDSVYAQIRTFYFGTREIDSTMKTELTNLITDAWFGYPQSYLINLHRKYTKAPVYAFVFGYRGSISYGPFYGDQSHNYGVCHGDDLNYLLSSARYYPTASDKQIMYILTTLWRNFAFYSDPTPKINELIKTEWNPVHGNDISYYLIQNENKIEMIDNLYSERLQFWEKLPINGTSYVNINVGFTAKPVWFSMDSTIISTNDMMAYVFRF